MNGQHKSFVTYLTTKKPVCLHILHNMCTCSTFAMKPPDNSQGSVGDTGKGKTLRDQTQK